MERKTDPFLLDALYEHLEYPALRVMKKGFLDDSFIHVLDDLAFLKAFLDEPPQKFSQGDIFIELQSLASKVDSLLCLSEYKKMNEEKTRELCTQLFGLLEPLQDCKNEARRIYEEIPKPSRFYYPTMGQLIFIDHLVENVEELVEDTSITIRPLKHFLLRLQPVLQSWRSRLTEMPEQRKKALVQSIGNLAYEVEYVIDLFQVRDFPTWHSMFWLLDILEEFQKVDPSERNDDDKMVGYEDEVSKCLESLVGGPKRLNYISIVGAAGQGKTTLVRWVYGHPAIISHFDVRAWCCVSQEYKIRDLLLELLGHIVELPDLAGKDDAHLSALIYQNLKGRRFLIVLDDVWNSHAWEDLSRCFNEDYNGSRFILTTRIQGVAVQFGRGLGWEREWQCIVQSLRRFHDEESWELLRKKLFKKERCPPELFDIGSEIARRCEGFPLSVISTARLLAKSEKTVDRWKQVAESLSSHILGEAKTESKSTIEMSYMDLPDHLKPCFLYLGMFLEDKEIPVSKLIRLWIAEGFIKHTNSESLEDVAESYLMDLISRNLVTVAKVKSIWGVKSCRVHNLIYEFCLTKAKEENFLQRIKGYDEHFPPSNDNLNLGLDSDCSYSSIPITYHFRRLGIYSKRNHFIKLKPHGPFVHTLLFFTAGDGNPSLSYDVSFMSQNFKVLTILDLEDINIGDSLKGIDVLVLLRYLALTGFVEFIPSSIANLWNLEIFILKGLGTKVVKIPDSIWDMANLRHLHIKDGASFDLNPGRVENPSLLDNLQTFSTISLAYGDGMEKILRRIHKVRKLKCILLDSRDDERMFDEFPDLHFLQELISLKMLYNGVGMYRHRFNLPSNLKKLTLSNFGMPWSEISQLCWPRNLEVLKLLCNAFEGEIWEISNNEWFHRLKFLKLEALNVEEWRVPYDVFCLFPVLETLILHKCKRLKEIPFEFGYIETLEMIDVSWCSPSLASSARIVQQVHQEQQERQEWENDRLKICIHPEVDLQSD